MHKRLCFVNDISQNSVICSSKMKNFLQKSSYCIWNHDFVDNFILIKLHSVAKNMYMHPEKKIKPELQNLACWCDLMSYAND